MFAGCISPYIYIIHVYKYKYVGCCLLRAHYVQCNTGQLARGRRYCLLNNPIPGGNADVPRQGF